MINCLISLLRAYFNLPQQRFEVTIFRGGIEILRGPAHEVADIQAKPFRSSRDVCLLLWGHLDHDTFSCGSHFLPLVCHVHHMYMHMMDSKTRKSTLLLKG